MSSSTTATTTTTAERSAALERLFQAAEKQSKGFVPFPEHLRSLDNRSSFSSSLAQHQANAHQKQKEEQKVHNVSPTNINDNTSCTISLQQQQQQQQKLSAYNFCASRVPQLSSNLERATTALESAKDAEEEVHAMLTRVDKMIEVTKTVRDYSERMSTNASALIAKRARVEGILNGVSDRLKKFQKIDSLHDEAIASTKYVANTSRFVTMLDEIENSAAFLADVSHFKQSAQVYSTRLSIAYQRSMSALRDHCCDALRDVSKKVTTSSLMKKLLLKPQSKEVAKKNIEKHQEPTEKEAAEEKDKEPKEVQPEEEDKERKEVASSNTTNLPSRPEKLSDALKLIDEEFTSALQPSETAFRLIEARIGAKEAEQFVADVFSSYSDARLLVVEPLLVEYSSPSSQTSQNSAASFNVTNFVHNMIEACVSEASLFQTIWVSDLSSSFLRGPLESLVSAGYEIFRSKLLSLDAVGQLCSLSFTLNDIQKKLHQHNKDANSNNRRGGRIVSAENNNNNNSSTSSNNKQSSSFVNSVSLRNELIGNILSRFIQDTDERLMFRVSIYLRNGLCAPSNMQQDNKQQVAISDWIFDRAVEALIKKVFPARDPEEKKTDVTPQQKEHEKFGAPHSIDIPTPFSTPFAIGPVVRLRWLCAQLKRSASGASAFAVFLEEATKAVIAQVNGLLTSSWTSRVHSPEVQKLLTGTTTTTTNKDDQDDATVNKMSKSQLTSALTNLLPYCLALRQLLLTREALLSVGARLSVSESSFAFTTMQISKVELEVPRVVEEPFRVISGEATKKLGAALASFYSSSSSSSSFKAFTCCLQICFDQSVATQQLIWRGAVPIAVDSAIKDNDKKEEKEKLKDSWNAML